MTVSPQPGPPARNYGSVQGGYGGTVSFGGGGPDTAGTATCSGAITTKYQWNPAYTGDTAPQCVVVTQKCTATCTGTSSGTTAPGSPTCTDGLGDAATPANPDSPIYSMNPPYVVTGTQINATSTGTHYMEMASGANFSVTCSPDASLTVYDGGVTVSVAYSVSITPVTIAITGTNSPSTGDYRVLTGQQMTATLGGTVGTVTSYKWTVGGGAFKTYDTTAPNSTNATQLVPLGTADLSGSGTVSPVSFYDGTAETLSVTCSVSATAPDGTSLPLTASAPAITVLKPTETKWTITTGNVYYSSSAAEYGLFPAHGSSAPGGVYWQNVTVSVPAPFSSIQGTCCFTQLVTPDHEYNGKANGANNKVQGLDNTFEYYNYTWAPSPTSLGMEDDSPAITVPSGKTYGDVATANDSLTAWVMYQPSGGVWVPLSSYTYTWAITLTWTAPDPGTWYMSGQSPPPPNPGPTYTAAATNTPPAWSIVQTNNE